ncbi:G-type lectin S-receptor-like serine/threonine-protein kinase RLK1 [Morella rubra]|uniref:Receptor-like serine/threonine-protein kinase n=1 Tax=Morella rubra TaxID=262757 RepID=A0A6A1VBQ9_9ROSI|nr:G-type lectin S-receptor-like serine/threonine-protein kinase RLK1 [Morella rubra]
MPPDAALVFDADGWLYIRSSTGQFEAIAQTQRATLASMLDSGNFVVYDSSSTIIWASFDYPTDTLLVGQTLLQDKVLYSSISETDTSIGNFQLLMQRDGNLYASPIRSLHDAKYTYWSSQLTSGAGRNVTLNLADDGRFYLSGSFGFSVKNLTEGGHPADRTKVLYRARFDVDGILRLYQHQMGTKGSSNFSILWTAIQNKDRCSVKGICGPNSFCAIDGADVSCLCPPGFGFVDPKHANVGCKLNFAAKITDCFANKGKANYVMSSVPNTAWELSEYDMLSQVSEAACSENCLGDCNCVVATFLNQMCYKQKLPLRFGKRNSSHPTKSLVKIISESSPGDTSTDTNVVRENITEKLGKRLMIVGIVLITFSVLVFLLSGYLVFRQQIWSYKTRTRQAHPTDFIEEINLRSFSYDQLAKATDNFKEEIGRGGSGKVYKGSLENNGGQEIAVKRLEKMVEERESVFRNEMKIIGRTHHKNLVQLIGFCSEGSNRLLVYKFMKNGSLGNLLFKSASRPNWNERTRILLEIARGIHYLHEECETRIIHCDIKPHNILMDESRSAKISDFGLSKLLKPDQTRTYTMPRGTRGYEAPEWHKRNAPITVKADVYSFGILLFEIICCRKNLALSVPEEEIVLTEWIYKSYVAGELRAAVGEEVVDVEELERMVKVGLWCLHTDAARRPSMKSVILMLEENVEAQPPPPPRSLLIEV